MLACLVVLAVQLGQRGADQRQRRLESELLFVGEQYRKAILSYYVNSPVGQKRWPLRLQDLVEDKRFPLPKRHLRQLYRDPLAPDTDWALVREGGGIVGVYSEALGQPFRQADLPWNRKGFTGATRYADWRFVAEAPVPVAAAPGTPVRPPTPAPTPATRRALNLKESPP